MKRSLLALAALTAFAGAASAQSSVTLFGILDVNARSQENGTAGTIRSLSTDGINSSRLGFRGVEDLGGGLRAGFWLEGALSPDNGGGTSGGAPGVAASGQTWQRRSTVSLMGAFGEVRLGRDYTSTFWNHTVFDPFGTNGVGSALNMFPLANLGQNLTTLVRANNVIGYFLPAWGGLYGQIQVAAGEGATGNKYEGGRLGYAAGPFNVAAAYGNTRRTNSMLDDLEAMNIGGSFNFGFMTLFAQGSEYKYNNSKLREYLGGVTVPVGPGVLKASYNQTDLDLPGSSPSANQIAVGYQYDLSKRTAVYANYSVIDNDNGIALTTSNSGPAFTASGQKSTGYEIGMRHSF